MVSNTGLNFIINRGGKLVKSLLCSKPIQNTINFKGLKYAPTLEKDVVQLTKNDYLANIKKLGLNEQDSKILENLLADNESYTPLEQKYLTELRQKFNQTVNRPDINLNELRTLFTGRVWHSDWLKKEVWSNNILENPAKLNLILEKLKSISPKDLEIIKTIDDDALTSLYKYGDFMIPDKYMGELSELLKNDRIYISKCYSQKLNKRIVECFGKGNKTYFIYDPEKGALVRFKKDGTQELIKERIFLKNSMGKPSEMITYEKSDVDGVFNVVQKDLKTGKKVPLSEAFVDSTGKKVVRQNLVSQRGTKSQIHYEEMPNGNTQYRYTIVDKKGNTLLEQVRSRDVLNDSEFVYKINDKSYNVKFVGSDKIEILNQQTKQLDTIDLKTLLSELADNEKAEMLTMLKRVPADELLALNKNGIKQILKGSIQASSTLPESGSISAIPNEFVFLHELGHQKDMAKNFLTTREKEVMRTAHKKFMEFIDDKFEFKTLSEKEIEDANEIDNTMEKLAGIVKKKIAKKISSNKELLKIYKKERATYIKKFGEDDERIDYFIRLGSGLGAEGEAVAEINALLSTPLSQSMLGTRSYLLAENFPETIAHASKLLL